MGFGFELCVGMRLMSAHTRAPSAAGRGRWFAGHYDVDDVEQAGLSDVSVVERTARAMRKERLDGAWRHESFEGWAGAATSSFGWWCLSKKHTRGRPPSHSAPTPEIPPFACDHANHFWISFHSSQFAHSACLHAKNNNKSAKKKKNFPKGTSLRALSLLKPGRWWRRMQQA
jgi:hypothetical protein